MSIIELNDKLGRLVEQARAIEREAADAGRDVTAEEQKRIDAFLDDYDKQKAAVDAKRTQEARAARLAEAEAELTQSKGRAVAPEKRHAGGRPEQDAALGVEVRGQRLNFAPGSAEAGRMTAEYRANFDRYLAGLEFRGLQTSNDSKGGYLAPVQFAARLIQALDSQVFIRGMATVLPPLTIGSSLGAPSLDTDPGDADWTAEVPASDISEDDSMTFGKRELTPHALTKLIKVSSKLIRASALDVDQIVLDRLAYKFAVTEEKGFLTGTGAQQPLGVFTASSSGVTTARDVTAASTTEFTADELINVKFGVKAQYMRNGEWIMHRDVVKMARKLKDGNGQYLWTAGLSGEPDRILDRPYHMSEFAPNTFTTGQYLAIFGDFRAGYWIADSLMMDLQRLTEKFALTRQVGILASKEADGMPVLAEAFSRLKLG